MQRQESGETPTSAAAELTHTSPDGNSNTSSCLTQIPLSTPFCVAPPPGSLAGMHQRHAALFIAAPQPHPRFKFPVFIPLQDFESSQRRGQAQHSPTERMKDGSGKQAIPSGPTGQISPVGQGPEGGSGLEGPDAATWAQKTVGWSLLFKI